MSPSSGHEMIFWGAAAHSAIICWSSTTDHHPRIIISRDKHRTRTKWWPSHWIYMNSRKFKRWTLAIYPTVQPSLLSLVCSKVSSFVTSAQRHHRQIKRDGKQFQEWTELHRAAGDSSIPSSAQGSSSLISGCGLRITIITYSLFLWKRHESAIKLHKGGSHAIYI